MINNVRISARKKKLEMDSANIEIDPKHFDPTFITSYVYIANKYSQENNYCICIYYLIIFFVL